MILAAALLVLVALGLFVAGLLTGANVWYWSCVGVAALAAILLFAARRQLARAESRATSRAAAGRPAVEHGSAGSGATTATRARPADSRPEIDDGAVEPEPVPVEQRAPSAEPAAVPAAAAPARDAASAGDSPGDPPPEEVEVSDLLLVVEMHDDVFVVDEHPRYHLADCDWLGDRETIPLPVDEARTDGFTPCGRCCPDRHLAEIARARRAASNS